MVERFYKLDPQITDSISDKGEELISMNIRQGKDARIRVSLDDGKWLVEARAYKCNVWHFIFLLDSWDQAIGVARYVASVGVNIDNFPSHATRCVTK